MFIQDQTAEHKLEKEVANFQNMLEALRASEIELTYIDEEIERTQKAIDRMRIKLQGIHGKIETLVEDPDARSREIIKLDEEKCAIIASVERYERAVRLVRLRREEKAIDIAEARRLAGFKRASILRPYVDDMIDQEIEELDGLMDALSLKSRVTDHSSAELLVHNSVEDYVIGLVSQKIRRKLSQHEFDISEHPIVSKLSIPKSLIDRLPDVGSPVATRNRKALIKQEKKQIFQAGDISLTEEGGA